MLSLNGRELLLEEEIKHTQHDQQADQENDADNPEYDFHDAILGCCEVFSLEGAGAGVCTPRYK